MQLPLLPRSCVGHDVSEYLVWLQGKGFDIRRRFYETDEGYHRRVLLSAYAFEVSYKEPPWVSLREWAEVCPRGPSDRLRRGKVELTERGYYLQIRDICPEDWLVPEELPFEPARLLPKRATYRPVEGDILLSRFREPLGKCVIYWGKPRPLYVNSNYFLLRPRLGFSPFLLLALLKSSFLACQLHHLIRRGTLITEMYQCQVPQIMMPNLATQPQEQIVEQAKKRLEAEEKYRTASRVNKDYWTNGEERASAIQVMNQVDAVVDDIVWGFTKQ